jgi:tape measure domain-containing protein
MPFNLGTAVYTFQVSGLSGANRQLNSFHMNLQMIRRGNFLGPLQGMFSRLNGLLSVTMGRLGITSALLGGLSALGGTLGVGGAVRLAAEMEQVQKSMQLLIGDVREANKLFDQLKSFSAETPLEFPGVLKATQSLLAGGVAAKEIVKTLRMIGDVAFPLRGAAGVEHLAQVYATFRSQGQITKQDVNQFAFMGIPIWEALAKVTGKTTAQVRQLVSAGKVGFPEMHNALVELTKEGSRFHNQMVESSKTLLGRWSTLIDILKTDVFTRIGQSIIRIFELPRILEQAIGFAQGFSHTFLPAVDNILLKLKSIFIESIPTIQSIIKIQMEFAKVGYTVLRTIGPIIAAISRWIGEHPVLVSWVAKLVAWGWVLNRAIAVLTFTIGMGQRAMTAYSVTMLTANAYANMLAGSLVRLRGAMQAVSAVPPINPMGGAGRAGAGGLARGLAGRVALPLALVGLGAYGASKLDAARGQENQNSYMDAGVRAVEELRKQREAAGLTRKPGSAAGPSNGAYPGIMPSVGTAGTAAMAGAKNRASFVGIADLTEKMQLEALNAARDKLLEEYGKSTADATMKIAGAVDGTSMRVAMTGVAAVPTTFGRP